MKLHSLMVHKSGTCDGLLDGLYVPFHEGATDISIFSPLCLIGPNGSGKSQVLQIIAEIFQVIFANFLPNEERAKPSNDIEFTIEYSIYKDGSSVRVRVSRVRSGRRKPQLKVDQQEGSVWTELEDIGNIKPLLPSKIIGYTSGDNETLSIPFLVSRSGYAAAVAKQAVGEYGRKSVVREPRHLLIDYGTNLEVLLANLLLNPEPVRQSLLSELNLKALRSFRCIIQLKIPGVNVKLTDELRGYIDSLVSCATKKEVDEEKGFYDLTFLVAEATHEAFRFHWSSALYLYTSLHKLGMLNDLAIPRSARRAFSNGLKARRFANRLPQPHEENKVFRIDSVQFASDKSEDSVDYISLSDGEHQLAQLLGVACMACDSNTLFLLDEPESHFNPNWRIEFISKLISQPTENGVRKDNSAAAMQECLITTHSPFVPSDLKRENVLIFNKSDSDEGISVRRPQIETYGSKFDAILAECFGVSPSISGITRDLVNNLLNDGSREEIEAAISELGESSERMKLAAKLAMLDGDA